MEKTTLKELIQLINDNQVDIILEAFREAQSESIESVEYNILDEWIDEIEEFSGQ